MVVKPGGSKGSLGSQNSAHSQSWPTTVGIVNHDPTRQRAPGYSFGVRYEEKVRPTPGPQYSGPGSDGSPSYSITGRPRRSVWDTMINKNPGPNTYSYQDGLHSSWERKAPMYSFGFPYRESKINKGPAPNSYPLPSTLGTHVPHLRGARAAAIYGKGSANTGFAYDQSKTPGPAGYNPVDLKFTTKQAPAVTMKGRPKLPPIKLVTPGPGAYDTGNLNSISKASPRFSMGVRHGDHVNVVFTMADVN